MLVYLSDIEVGDTFATSCYNSFNIYKMLGKTKKGYKVMANEFWLNPSEGIPKLNKTTYLYNSFRHCLILNKDKL